MTPSGVEPATFRFVAQHLNHCATAVPPPQKKIQIYYNTCYLNYRILNTTKLMAVWPVLNWCWSDQTKLYLFQNYLFCCAYSVCTERACDLLYSVFEPEIKRLELRALPLRIFTPHPSPFQAGIKLNAEINAL